MSDMQKSFRRTYIAPIVEQHAIEISKVLANAGLTLFDQERFNYQEIVKSQVTAINDFDLADQVYKYMMQPRDVGHYSSERGIGVSSGRKKDMDGRLPAMDGIGR